MERALVASEYQAFIGGITVLSPYRVRFTLPALSMYNVRVPETIRLTVPGSTLTSREDISYQQPDEPDNEFQLLPNEAAAETLEVSRWAMARWSRARWNTTGAVVHLRAHRRRRGAALDVEYSEAMRQVRRTQAASLRGRHARHHGLRRLRRLGHRMRDGCPAGGRHEVVPVRAERS